MSKIYDKIGQELDVGNLVIYTLGGQSDDSLYVGIIDEINIHETNNNLSRVVIRKRDNNRKLNKYRYSSDFIGAE